MNLEDATILIADDEVDLVAIFKRWFEREGSRVLTAENGAAALEILAHNRVDVVVSDVRMPVMDGIELAKRIRPGHDHSPKMVFVSGYTGGLNAQECRDLGIDTILSKPVDRHAIVDAVRQTLA